MSRCLGRPLLQLGPLGGIDALLFDCSLRISPATASLARRAPRRGPPPMWLAAGKPGQLVSWPVDSLCQSVSALAGRRPASAPPGVEGIPDFGWSMPRSV